MDNKYILFVLFLLFFTQISAQLITFNGTGNLPIPPGAPVQTIGVTQSSNSVSGIGLIGGCVTIENVTIDLIHPWVGDIAIHLIGPGGQILELSTSNGGAGNNYTNTVFSDDAGAFITTGTPPYSGNFRPEGRNASLAFNNIPPLGTFTFASTYNGTNADGNWILNINDYVIADVGELLSWSITFNLNGTPPVANAGPDVAICPGQSTTLVASGGGTYLWSNGATTASTTVNPTINTTYTVTVTSAGCGSSTDNVLVTLNPLPAVTFTATTTDLCQDNCLIFNANFTGVAPFTLEYKVTASNSVVQTFTQVFTSNAAPITVCAPPGTPVGSFVVQAVSLTDANCTCQ
jgi:subtilisin-like proprotein convertase family protein